VIQRIILKNFMAHADTTLELVPGLNVLVGPNNCGKSAVVSALQLLCSLPPREGPYMMKHGASECSVTVETDDSQFVSWVRNRTTFWLQLNDERLDRIVNDSENALSRLHTILKLPQVKPEGSNRVFDIHFALQKQPIFLLDSKSDAAAFFASSSDAERLLRMRKRFQEIVREKKSQKQHLQQEVERNEEELQWLRPLDELKEDLSTLQENHAQILYTQAQLDALAQSLEDLTLAHDKWRHLKNEGSILQDLTEPPQLVDTAPLERLTAELTSTIEQHGSLTAESTILQGLAIPPVLEDERPLEALTHGLKDACLRHDAIIAETKVLNELSNPPIHLETDSLDRLIRDYSDARARHLTVEAEYQALEGLDTPPAVADTSTLATLMHDIGELMTIHQKQYAEAALLQSLKNPPELESTDSLAMTALSMADLQEELVRAHSEKLQADQEYDQYVRQHGKCPHCGSQLQLAAAGGSPHED
jgi:hypothetical protein